MVKVALVGFMDDGHDLVVRTIREHAGALLRTARRHSLCLDDAQDAYQRGLEIFLRRAATLEPETAIRWLHVVVANEAKAVRAARLELVGADEAELDARRADREPEVHERAVQWDRMARSAEALQRLKPQEVTALWLKAQGLSYAEIARSQQWTYTKVNRCLVEGRRAFLQRYAGIEAGEECTRWAPVVAALVDGEATAEQVAAARPHLRRCAACRATLRELRTAGPRLAGVLPVAGLLSVSGSAAGAGSGRRDALVGVLTALHDRVLGWALRLQGVADMAPGAKVAAVAASAAVVAGGGAVTIHEVAHRPLSGTPRAERVAAAPRGATRGSAVARVALRTPASTSGLAAGSGAVVMPHASSSTRPAASPAPEFSPVREFRAAGLGAAGEFGGVRLVTGAEFGGAVLRGGAAGALRVGRGGDGAARQSRRVAVRKARATPSGAEFGARPRRGATGEFAGRGGASERSVAAGSSSALHASTTPVGTRPASTTTPSVAPAATGETEFSTSSSYDVAGGSASTRGDFSAGPATEEFGGG